MRPILTKAERVVFARCWGLWRRWLVWERRLAAKGARLDRALLFRLWGHIREEMRDGDD